MRNVLAAVAMLGLAAGCDGLPSHTRHGDSVPRPSQIRDFATLYGESCAGCHGSESGPGAAVALADPVYLALVDDATLRRVTAEGVPGTAMPGFARSAGGSLTDEQIDIIVSGMRSRWARTGVLGNGAPPPYGAPPGDPARGAHAYGVHCATCHGPAGTGGAHGGSVVDGSYLALVSDQSLRTAILVGRPALGMPDWRGDGKGQAMTAQDVSDVVAWLIDQRPKFPGQPYPTAERTGGADR